ncbi:MAG: hydrogenase small subunit [Actinomycetia bacterium]|nr:hydrogenase small subunit [Actinomycetes bacterium]
MAVATDLYERLAAHGITRRDFLKFCGTLAAVMGLSQTAVPQIAAAVGEAAGSGLYPALWINGAACTGCTESIAQATQPNVADIVLDILSLPQMETVMMASGEYAEKAGEEYAAANKGKYILICEGAVTEMLDGNVLRIAEKPYVEILQHYAEGAAAIVAVGSCAVDGGWVRAYPNPAKATGVKAYLDANISNPKKRPPVVNLPGCPVNPLEIIAVVVNVLLTGDLTKILKDPVKELNLDRQNRPKYLYGSTIHDNCERRGHFENGEFVYQFGGQAEADNYCLYAMGCKGPQTYRHCSKLRWNNNMSWCVASGGPCIGCGNFNWVDNNTPFRQRMRRIGAGVIGGPGGLGIAKAGAIVGGVVVVGIGAHALASKATHRIGKNSTLKNEEMKTYDARKLKKKGGSADA